MRMLEVMHSLPRDDFNLDFCVLSGESGDLDAEVRNLGGEVIFCPLGGGFSRRFVKLLRTGRYEVVHSHVHMASGYILRLARRAGVPIRVAHFHSTHDGKRGSWRRRIQRVVTWRWVDRHATAILGVNQSVLRLAWSGDWQLDPRCRVLFSSVDTARLEVRGAKADLRRRLSLPDGPLVIHVGTFQADKNQRRVISVFGALCRRLETSSLVLVGRNERSDVEAVIAQAEALSIADRVLIMGEREDVPSLMGAADLLLFPSRREGLPGVILEAQGCCLPVLASDLPGVEEVKGHLWGVQTLSLERSDGEWAEAAALLLEQPPVIDASVAHEQLERGPFGMERCIRDLSIVWLGG